MWNKVKMFLGINTDIEYYNEILNALHQEAIKRNFYFHLFIIGFECLMMISISLRPGGPFVKPRREAYFFMYLLLILVTVGVTAAEVWADKKEKGSSGYFRLEHPFMMFFCFWCVTITLIDQLGGNGLTVFNYAILILAILSMMKPWQTILLITASFMLLNVLLPYFPDPTGLDNSFNNFMNSLYISLAAGGISATLYHSKVKSIKDEIIIKKQYLQIEEANKMLSHEARYDALTNLQNRNSYKVAVKAFTAAECTSFACIYIDVNGLHEINNHLGHQAGDVMLQTVADILLMNFETDEVFRIGGDEFVVLCRNIAEESVIQKIECMCGQVGRSGYSLSIGLEWRDADFNIAEMIQAAETAMQRDKREYYSAQGGERQRRILNRKMELLISEKKDAERFMSVLAPVFKGVYFVNLKTDTLRQIFIPEYFQKMIDEADGLYSKALMIYASQLVEPQYLHLFEQFCDYGNLERMLDGEDIPGFLYRKKDGEQMRLRILKFSRYTGGSRETLWIFSDIEANELF